MASLERLWKEGRDGALSPLEQMRAWALRTAQRDIGGDKAVNLEKIADRVTKVGGGHPTREAIRQLLERVDADPEWYPGKTYRKRPGPQAVLHGKKRKQVATSAMNLKKGCAEPTYAAIAARCPAAVVNPDTGKPVDNRNTGACMICIGGDLHRRPPMHALYALSQDAPAGRGCAEEMCYRRRTRPQDGGRRVPTREKIGLQCWGKRTGKTPCDDPRAPPRGVHPGARGRRRRNREPKVSHVSLWVAPGRAGGHPRPRSPPGSRIGLRCSERGRSGCLRT